MPSVRIPAPLPDGVSQATIGVRGGLLRSGFEETAEAMFLTSGYVYSSAAEAEKAFTGEIDRYVYSRYGNPTISMFEERLRLIEGAPAAFATASGMAAVFTSLGALLGAGDRLVAARSLFGSCFVVCSEILPRWGVEVEFVDGDDLVAMGAGAEQTHSGGVLRDPVQPDAVSWSTSPRCPSWLTPPVQKWCWTTSSPLRFCSRASRWGWTWWCTPAPSTSTVRAGCWAGRSSATRSTSTGRCRS